MVYLSHCDYIACLRFKLYVCTQLQDAMRLPVIESSLSISRPTLESNFLKSMAGASKVYPDVSISYFFRQNVFKKP